MTLVELRKMISSGEGRFVEFKKKADHPNKIVREMVAFANSGGGWLFLGVDDKGNITGLPYPDEDLYVMEAALNQYVKPEIEIELERVKVSASEEVLAYYVKPSPKKPIFWLVDKEKQVFRAYVRHEDKSLQASKEMFQVLKTDPQKIAAGSFQFSPLEKNLLSYLDQHEHITLSGLVRLTKLPYWVASRKLVSWVRLGVLHIEPAEGEDLYYLSSSFSSD